ncbi:MAG: hypothetical protein ABW219_17545 [Ilumatobacteraceae bacterium]
MKLLKPMAAAALVVSVLATPSPAVADAPAKPPRETCSSVHATGSGVSNPTTGETTADIAAGHGLPIGTTYGAFTISGGTPPVFEIAGPIVFTAMLGPYPIGTLTITTTGTFDTQSGAFTSSGPITASSGILRGVTGRLTFAGIEDLTTHRFTETVTGTLCAKR